MSLRPFSTTLSTWHIPIALKSLPSTLATEVLPVHRFPVQDDVHGTDRGLASELHPALLETHLLRKIPQGFLDRTHSDERVQLLHHALRRNLLRAVRPGYVLPGQDFARAGIFIITHFRRSGAKPLKLLSKALRTSRALPKVSVRPRYIRSKNFPTFSEASSVRVQPLLSHHVKEYLSEFPCRCNP